MTTTISKTEGAGFQGSSRPEQSDQGAPDQFAKIAHRGEDRPIRRRGQPFWVCGRDTLVGGNVQDFHDTSPASWWFSAIGLARARWAAVRQCPLWFAGGILEIRNWWVFRATSQRGPGVAVR